MSKLFGALMLWLLVAGTVHAETWYQVDWGPFQKHKALYERYEPLRHKKGATFEELKAKRDIMSEIVALEPRWLDGKWLAAQAFIQLGETYSDEKDLPVARALFDQAREVSESCLKQRSDFILCKFWLGVAIARTAAVDGVFASLRHAADVERYWKETVDSDLNYRYDAGYTLRGSATYGLGIFYRVLPDSWLLSVFFGVRGNIDRAIAFHRRSIEIDGDGYACGDVMFAAALLCGSDSPTDSRTKEAKVWLDKALALKDLDPGARLCQFDAPKLAKDPTLACGYTTTRQQDVSEEALTRQTEAEKAKAAH